MTIGLLLELTKRDFTEKYSGSMLGVLWAFIGPLVNIFIYLVIFSKMMGARLPGVSSTFAYGTYLAAGIIPWAAFASTLIRSSTIFVDKKALISKIRISLPFLPLYIVLSETVIFLITITIYLIFLILAGNPFTTSIIFIPFVFIVQQIFAYGLGFIIAIFQVFIRDLREVTNIIVQLWFWFTPIVYVYDILPDFAKKFFIYNPAYLFIKAYQNVFVYGKMPDFYSLIAVTLIGHLLLIFGYISYKRLEKDIRDFI